jgi:protein-tyrosine phosphatase
MEFVVKTELFWIPAEMPGRLAIMPRPRGGDWLEDEVKAWRSEGVDLVVSLLVPSEIVDLDVGAEESLCHGAGIEFHTFPIADRGVPSSRAAFLNLATVLANDLAAGKNIAIHCRQGIGRAPLLAIAVLVLTGLCLETATAAVGQARGCAVPETTEQQRWLGDLARDLPLAARK